MKWGEVVGIRARCWECRYMHICNFTYAHKIVQPSLPQFSQTPQIINSIMFRCYMQNFHPHWQIKEESTHGCSLHSKVKYGLHCTSFSQNSATRTAFVDISCTKYHPNWTKMQKTWGKKSHMYLGKVRHELCLFSWKSSLPSFSNGPFRTDG